MRDQTRDDRLRALLRAGDPAAADPGLSPAERAAMRRRTLTEAREHRRPHGWLVPATAVLALLALALGLAWRGTVGAPPRVSALSPPPSPAAAAGTEGQQVQFVTESGTLVVWVLQPRSTG